jgi:rhodanese-related sulfurtransferase
MAVARGDEMTNNREDEEATLQMARFDLMELDGATWSAKDLLHAKPIDIEVSKALTVAQLHKDIEARVICDTVLDVYRAVKMLKQATLSNFDGKWDQETRTLELPNGSAVVVKFQARISTERSD